jgi:predicted DNA-binding transcriptional regulator AlpA
MGLFPWGKAKMLDETRWTWTALQAEAPMRSLTQLLESPMLLDSLTREEIAAALVETTDLRDRLTARLDLLVATPQTQARSAPAQERLLTAVEVAERLGVTVRWVYRHADRWPFTHKLSRKVLRFSESGLVQLLSRRRTRA